MTRQFLKFLLVGAVAATANVGSRIVFAQWIDFVPAMACAFLVGMGTAFILNRSWVFLASGRHWAHEVGWFITFNLLGLAQTIAIAWLLAIHVFPRIGFIFHAETVAHTVGVLVPIVTSFLGHKFLTFRRIPHV